jgi:mRNA-degrading endonuclease RelE of RelBE toxin-antitoxin system
MSYSVKTLVSFEKQAKRLIKKYPSLKNEIQQLISSLKEAPNQGTPLGNNCFKIRLSITSKGKGKSGGGRVISHVIVSKETVYLVSIYDKSELSSLTPAEIKMLLDQVD